MLLVNGIRKKFWLKIGKNNFHRTSRSVQYETDKVGEGGLVLVTGSHGLCESAVMNFFGVLDS